MRLTFDQRRFLARALVCTACLWVTAEALAARYRIAVDSQIRRCLPWRVFLLDLNERAPQVGEYYAFTTDAMAPRFPASARFVKLIAAGPGDVVDVRRGVLWVNGRPLRQLETEVLTALGRRAEDFERHEQLTRDQFLMLGTERGAYDGRYWGPIRRSDILARATPLW